MSYTHIYIYKTVTLGSHGNIYLKHAARLKCMQDETYNILEIALKIRNPCVHQSRQLITHTSINHTYTVYYYRSLTLVGLFSESFNLNIIRYVLPYCGFHLCLNWYLNDFSLRYRLENMSKITLILQPHGGRHCVTSHFRFWANFIAHMILDMILSSFAF